MDRRLENLHWFGPVRFADVRATPLLRERASGLESFAHMTSMAQRASEADSRSSPRRAMWPAATIFTLLAALAPAVLWIGDISWSNDEAELISQAWFGNKAHLLVQRGLAGNFTISYGPLPTQ